MNHLIAIVVLVIAGSWQSAGADPADNGPTTTQQYLRWLDNVQAPLDARQAMHRKYPDVKFNADGFLECVNFLRDVAISNLILDVNALGDAGVNQSIPITFTRSDTTAADLIQRVLDQADPVQHRIQYAVQDEFVFISSTEGVRRLDDFERKFRPPSHDFGNALNLRILTQRSSMEMVDDMCGLDNYASMQFSGTDVVSAFDAVSKRVNVPIDVDWKSIGAARLGKNSRLSLRFRNLTLFDALTVMLGQVYDLDRIEIVGDGSRIRIWMASSAVHTQPVPLAQ